jgi:transcriptional regulator with XRE-family HTH domain
VAKRLQQAFGAVLRDRRLRARLSQEELGHRAKTSQGYVSLVERGERSPSIVMIDLFAKALDTSMSALLRSVEREMQK